MRSLMTYFRFTATILAILTLASVSFAADNLADSRISDNSNSSGSLALSIDKEQRLLADQFAKLEELFIRLAELDGGANPTRASLLNQAAQLSKQLATQQRLSIAVDLLAKNQFTRALQEQEAARDNLRRLLELLQRENRSERLKDDRLRIEQLIKDVQRIGRLQKSLRGRTEAGQDKTESTDEQKSLSDQAEALAKELDKLAAPPESKEKTENGSADAGEDQSEENQADEPTNPAEKAPGPSKDGEKGEPNQGNEGKQAEPKDSSSEKSDANDSEPKGSESQDGKSENENNNSEKKNSDQQSPKSDGKESQSESQPSQGKPSDSSPQQSGSESQPGQAGENDQSQDEQPKEQPPQSQEQRAQQRVQRAQQRMEKAVEELEEDKRPDAVKEQRAAEEELAAAVEELERILQQMREEEAERQLADLQSRFRRMLTMQTQILTETEKYAHENVSVDPRQRELQSVKLSIEERKVLIEGQRAMLLLEEEGSSMAFPEAVEQINSDLAILIELFNASRLDAANVDLQTQVVSTLEELIEALTKAQKDAEKKKQDKQQNAQQGNPPEQNQQLVDALAELRLIKTLQLRINKRTLSLAEQAGAVDDPLGPINDPLLTRQVRELSDRQMRVERVIRDIVLEAARK